MNRLESINWGLTMSDGDPTQRETEVVDFMSRLWTGHSFTEIEQNPELAKFITEAIDGDGQNGCKTNED